MRHNPAFHRIFSIFSSFALAACLTACNGDDGSTEGGSSEGGSSESGTSESGSGTDGGTEGMPGVTDCTPPGLDQVLCQAGQYCQDSVLGMCTNGCLSNDNCTDEQTCDKAPGADVGSCQNMTSGPTEDEFCTKAKTCDPTLSDAQCSMLYVGSSQACHECIVAENCSEINDFDGICDDACGW